MLNNWLGTSVSMLSTKHNTYIISTLTTRQPSIIYRLYYELHNVATTAIFSRKVNAFLFSLFVPFGVTIRQIFLYKIYLEYCNKTYKFLRLLYNLPVRKTRTHSTSKKLRWVSSVGVGFCVKTVPLFRQLKLPQAKIKALFFCEFINSVWFFNWWKDWFSAYRTRIKSVAKNSFIKWKYDLVGLQQGRVVFFNTKKKKVKHNRKKSTVPKNTYNVGFNYGFTLTHIKRIFAATQKQSPKQTKKVLKKKK